MKTELLLELADMLEADAAQEGSVRFDLEVIGQVSPLSWYHKLGLVPKPPVLSCRTAACALGLAALSGQFEGLTARVTDSGGVFLLIDGESTPFVDAGMETFGLTRQQSEHLFDPRSYAVGHRMGPEAELMVAQRIRKMVSRWKEPSAG